MVCEARRRIMMAKEDLGVAKHLFETYYPRPLEIICYHCQQAAEKATKAMIMDNGSQGGIPRSHDISFLMNQIKNMIEIPEAYYDYADILTPYGVSVRYPSELFLETKDAAEALHCAEEIVQWAENICTELK